jgi:hypothetical protein
MHGTNMDKVLFWVYLSVSQSVSHETVFLEAFLQLATIEDVTLANRKSPYPIAFHFFTRRNDDYNFRVPFFGSLV